MSKNKHMTDYDRLQIEYLLKEGVSLNKIAEELGRSTSTISREVRARALPSDKSAYGRTANRCLLRKGCIKCQICEDKPDCTRRCSYCKLCNSLCPDFEEEVCLRLYDPPYVCNGCFDERNCTLRKRYYIHKKAHEAYREMLVESRTGANISEDELIELDNFVSPLLRHGQSIHHAVANNPDHFNVSEKTIYRYVSGNLLTAKNIDLPRVCRLKPRKSKPVQHKVDVGCRIGRTYPEFLRFVENNRPAVVEMDSVIGRVGGKVLLTMLFKSCDFMIAIIRDRNTSQSVIDCFNWMFKEFGTPYFKALFPVILCDNGSEFSNPKALEFDALGNRRTHVFYCDPNASFQKPNVELNHEFIRRILPKGYSFDNLVQEDIDLMMSHINSYSREKLNDNTPVDTFGFLYGHSVIEKLGQRKIPANDIVLKPSLLKQSVAVRLTAADTLPHAVPEKGVNLQ
ncbi:MAG: IS30 family transposase [Oscillospiraceae bacterium]|nr:IS30 family transposase [Oscillospiraceae bacterium]